MNPNPVVQNLSFENQSARAQVGDNTFDFNIQLLNGDGDNVGIKYSSVVELVITDDLSQFCSSGYLTFNNMLDALESSQSISTDVRGRPEQAFNPFRFRGDGRDLIIINIKPAIDTDSDDPIRLAKTSSLNKTFSLNGVYAIYDTEDIISDVNKDVKLKKIYFHDKDYQTLNEKNAYFNTASLIKKEDSKRLVSNTDRSVDTGSAIKELLKSTLEGDTEPVQFSSLWDTGKSKIFYSSPANNRAIDDLYYLLDYHVSDSDASTPPALLKKDRNGAWGLIPLTTLFKTSYYKGNEALGDLGGPGLTENFIIARPNAGDGPVATGPQRNPQTSIFANNLVDYSIAENFENSSMSADTNTFGMVSHIVHNYDPATKTFSLDLKENNINETMKKFGKNIVQTQRGVSGKSPKSNVVLNETRSQNKNVVHTFNPNTDPNARINSGSNKILLNSIFCNNTIAFRTRGNTARQSGKFISMQRQNFQNNSDFDNKIMGTYLVVKVDHVFKNGQYFNYMICTKPYNAQSSGMSNKVT